MTNERTEAIKSAELEYFHDYGDGEIDVYDRIAFLWHNFGPDELISALLERGHGSGEELLDYLETQTTLNGNEARRLMSLLYKAVTPKRYYRVRCIGFEELKAFRDLLPDRITDAELIGKWFVPQDKLYDQPQPATVTALTSVAVFTLSDNALDYLQYQVRILPISQTSDTTGYIAADVYDER